MEDNWSQEIIPEYINGLFVGVVLTPIFKKETTFKRDIKLMRG